MNRLRFGVIGLVGFLAVVQGWTNSRRPYPSQLTGGANLRVTTADDNGAGSLRDAILSADRLGSPARIQVLVARINLATSLPPLINPKGITLESVANEFVVDGAHIENGPVLEVRSAGAIISGMRVENAPHSAIVLAAQDLHIRHSSFSGCDTAVEIAPGGGDLVIEDSTFEKNRIGLLANVFERNVAVENSRFLAQGEAGIWSVTDVLKPTVFSLNVGRNQFKDNRFGVVAGNHRLQLHDNEIKLSAETGVQLFGEGAIIQHNTISNGLGTGILAESLSHAVISENEIHHNRNVGIVIKNSSDDAIRHNTIYSNGNGIAFVYGNSQNPIVASQNTIFSQIGEAIVVVGDSPILNDNVLRSNRLGALAGGSVPAAVPAAAPGRGR